MAKKNNVKKEKKNLAEKPKLLALLDAHAIIHRAYHALPDFESSKGEATGALYGLVTMINKLVSDINPDYVVACFDLPSPTHRHDVYEGYKSGRKKIDDALAEQIERSKDVFAALGIPMYSVKGFEADDVLATIVEELKDEPVNIIIASGDMDTMQLVSGKKVQVYTLRKGIKDVVLYDEDAVAARYGFGPEHIPDYKGLAGDTSDNIIGVPGIGEKTATSLIQTFGTIENIYKKLRANKEAFSAEAAQAGVKPRAVELLAAHEDEARFSKMLATVRRDAPIVFALPELSWREGVEIEKVAALFKELEFRTLLDRVKDVIAGKGARNGSSKTETTSPEGDSSDLVAAGLLFSSKESIPPEELEKVALALWVVDSNITNPTLEEILNYAQTNSFEKARDIIFSRLKDGAQKVYDTIELPLMPVIKRMEACGVKIDTLYLSELSREYHTSLNKLQAGIWKLAGHEFNINSPKQLGDVLFDELKLTTGKGSGGKTSGGARTTKESELQKLAEHGSHPIIPLILEYRELQKLLSTYIDNIPKQLGPDGRLHARFVQTGTTTGRISSQEPNLQNIPIKTELGRRIRDAFVAEPGFVVGAFDYSQIELRIAAFMSGDQKLIEIFKSGGDIHTGVASEVFGVPVGKVDSEMRRRAKVINFGIMYGMGVNALRVNLGAQTTTREEAKRFYDEYFEKFSTLAEYLENTKREAAKTGYTETYFGRRRYFPGLRSKLPFMRAAAERMAINAPLQGTAADIMKLAMIRIDEFLTRENLQNDVRLILTVHDELVFEIRESVVEWASAEIRRIMERGVLEPKDMKDVPLVVHGETGKTWGSAK